MNIQDLGYLLGRLSKTGQVPAVGDFCELRKRAGLELDIEKGDTLLGGRFKNHKEVVKEIGTDELGQPTINGKKLLAFRIAKLMKKADPQNDATPNTSSNPLPDKAYKVNIPDPKVMKLWNSIKDLKKQAVYYPADVHAALMGPNPQRLYGKDYLNGELDEFHEALDAKDVKGVEEEKQDVMYAVQMLAYQLTKNNTPLVGADDKIKEFLHRPKVFESMFKEKNLPFNVDYLAGGSNYKKPAKIMAAFQLAGSPITEQEAGDLLARHGGLPKAALQNKPSQTNLLYKEIQW